MPVAQNRRAEYGDDGERTIAAIYGKSSTSSKILIACYSVHLSYAEIYTFTAKAKVAGRLEMAINVVGQNPRC
jgi:hypothetical protein